MTSFSTEQKMTFGGRQVDLVTQDFLGGSFGTKSTDMNLINSHVPPGREGCMDHKSEKLNIPRVAPFPDEMRPSCSRTQAKPSLNLALELGVAAKTPSNALPIHENSTYRSVITIDDVRSALERFSTSLGSASKKRPNHIGSSSSSSSIESILDPFGSVKVAVACPACLMYVMVLRTDRKCPNCGYVVRMAKKPKAYLNLSI